MPAVVAKVFLSTTAKDLAAYRDKVHDHLNDSGFFQCVSQKAMGPEDASAIDHCRKQAMTADIYVGLIGLRRGWEPDGNGPKRSITEMEHDWAKEAGKRCYLWVVPDDFLVPGNIRENDDQHGRQMAFRARVMAEGERIVSQQGFGSPDLLAAQITQRLIAALHSEPIQHVRESIPQLEQLPDAIVTKLMAALDARGDTKKAESAGLERDIIIKLARRIKPDEALDFDQAMAELDNAVGIALEAIAKGHRPSNQDDFVRDVLARVAEQTKAGQFDRAAKEVDGALAELDRREEEQQQTLKRSRIALLEAGIAQDILRRDAAAVARRIERVALTEHPNHPARRFEALHERGYAFHVEGRDKGLNFFLEIAIAVAHLAVSQAHEPDELGNALNDLGISLGTLGDRESGTARLEEAVKAFRAALPEYTRERVPLDWATTQNNLGGVLATIGERENGTARLEEAVAAYRNALLERTPERVPLDWAMTQNNLGTALWRLGEREGGTARLEEAIAAFRNALLKRTREHVPLQWAMTRNNLGLVLWRLGDRGRDTARLEEAIAAFRDALLEITRERVPLQWAGAKNNLGNALATIGERENRTARLEEAVAAYRDALLERTRERVPLDWAMTQNNLGAALRAVGERESGTARLEQAVEAYRAALEVFEQGGASYYLDLTRENLARAETLLAKRRSR